MRRRRCFSVIVRLSGRALGRCEQLAEAFDVVGPDRSGEQAVVADAMEAAGQQVQEKAADELGGVEGHGLEAVAAFDPVVLTWGVLGQVGDSFMRARSVCVGVCRYLAFGSWQRKWRARDEGQGCEAPAKPACAERTSLTRVARSPKLVVKSEWRVEQLFFVSVSRSRARLPDAARFRARSTSHPVAARDGCTNIPLAAGRGSGERNHSSNRRFRPWTTSVRPPDPPEPIRPWKICESVQRLSSGDLHHGSLNEDAGGDIFPQRHEKLAGERDDDRLLHTAAVAFDPFFEP